MSPDEFREVQARLGWTIEHTAERLGVSVSLVKKMRTDRGSGTPVPEPTARLMQLWADLLALIEPLRKLDPRLARKLEKVIE